MNIKICHLDGTIEFIENVKISLLTRDGIIAVTQYSSDKKAKSVRNYIMANLLYYETGPDEEKMVDGCEEENSPGWREKQIEELKAEVSTLRIADNIAKACSMPGAVFPSTTYIPPCEMDRWK